MSDPVGPAGPVVDGPAGVLWTIGEALEFLDPSPPRRTLSRWLRQIPSCGVRDLPQGGPPARLYPAREVMARHAKKYGGNTT